MPHNPQFTSNILAKKILEIYLIELTRELYNLMANPALLYFLRNNPNPESTLQALALSSAQYNLIITTTMGANFAIFGNLSPSKSPTEKSLSLFGQTIFSTIVGAATIPAMFCAEYLIIPYISHASPEAYQQLHRYQFYINFSATPILWLGLAINIFINQNLKYHSTLSKLMANLGYVGMGILLTHLFNLPGWGLGKLVVSLTMGLTALTIASWPIYKQYNPFKISDLKNKLKADLKSRFIQSLAPCSQFLAILGILFSTVNCLKNQSLSTYQIIMPVYVIFPTTLAYSTGKAVMALAHPAPKKNRTDPQIQKIFNTAFKMNILFWALSTPFSLFLMYCLSDVLNQLSNNQLSQNIQSQALTMALALIPFTFFDSMQNFLGMAGIKFENYSSNFLTKTALLTLGLDAILISILNLSLELSEEEQAILALSLLTAGMAVYSYRLNHRKNGHWLHLNKTPERQALLLMQNKNNNHQMTGPRSNTNIKNIESKETPDQEPV